MSGQGRKRWQRRGAKSRQRYFYDNLTVMCLSGDCLSLIIFFFPSFLLRIPVVLSPFQSYGNIPLSIVMNLAIILIDTLTMYNTFRSKMPVANNNNNGAHCTILANGFLVHDTMETQPGCNCHQFWYSR